MSVPDYKDLSDFISRTQVLRTEEKAEIVVKYTSGELKLPIRLYGFKTKAYLTDFEIWEEGYLYYLALVEYIKKL